MNIRGSQILSAPPPAAFAAICDPDALLGIIPGCREIERVGESEYRGLIALRLPGVVGTYKTVVRLVEADPPSYGRLDGELEGSLGTLKGTATFRLTPSGTGTKLEYEGSGAIGGPLARLDSRFVEGLAASLIKQGLRNLDSRLAAERSADVEDRRQPTTEITA
jgi:carbon monoxide dehydrogenase subunit G